MIADRIISNYDTHTNQFRIDEWGRVISYDKGQSFKFFKDRARGKFNRPEPETFTPTFHHPFLGLNRSVYAPFCAYLQQNPEVLVTILASTSVKECFQRCSQLSQGQQIQEWLQPYANIAFPGEESAFFDTIKKRAGSIESDIKRYFTGSEIDRLSDPQ